MSVSNLALSLSLVVAVGCGGGDGRSDTAPTLPFPLQNAACSEYDDLGDGTIDAVYTYKYDSAGFVIETATDGYLAKTTYGKDHFETRFEVESTGDGVADLVVVTDRDDEGRRERVETTEVDMDETTVTVETFTYDGRGRLTMRSRTETVTPKTGAATTETSGATLTYTGSDLIPTVVVSTDADGVATRSTYVQLEGGRAVDISVDEGDNGTVDSVTHETYDADGRLLTSEDTAMGMITLRIRSTYDDRGAETSFNLDFDGMDPLDVMDVTTFEAGNRTKEVLTSPSGNFDPFTYTETYKATCAAARAGGRDHLDRPRQRDANIRAARRVDRL